MKRKQFNQFFRRSPVAFKVFGSGGVTVSLKGQCHEIFDLNFFTLIEPLWVPDKQAKMVFLTNLFSRRYSKCKVQKI